ncbi:alanine racemase [Pseudomonas sp. SDO528_S397]
MTPVHPANSGLPSLRHPLIEQWLAQHPRALHQLVESLGSPLHLVFPQIMGTNIEAFQQVFKQARVPGRLLFAKKANKADSFVRACREYGIGVDVASVAELEKSLAAGITGRQIGLSGPHKSETLLRLGLAHQSQVAIDSLNELDGVHHLAQTLSVPARLLLRYRPDSQAHSRFGLTDVECERALAYCRAHRDRLRVEGFAFHLSGYSTQERARTASHLIDLCHRRGLSTCRQVNMGGGFAVGYVAPQHWQTFTAQDRPEHYHGHKTFQGFYPYGSPRGGAEALHDVLTTVVEGRHDLAHKARAHGVSLIIEPGRALLDQAGMSVFRVQGVKDRHATDGYAHVTVQGSSLSLSEQWFNSEFLPEPLLLPVSPRPPEPFVACIGGASCLDGDMLTWRKLTFSHPLRAGDLLIYLNTAGYQMDSNESPFHGVALPQKVAVQLHPPHLHWKLDHLA